MVWLENTEICKDGTSNELVSFNAVKVKSVLIICVQILVFICYRTAVIAFNLMIHQIPHILCISGLLKLSLNFSPSAVELRTDTIAEPRSFIKV